MVENKVLVLSNNSVWTYMDARSIEALKYGFRRITTNHFEWGSITYYHDIMGDKFVYATPYVFEPLRKGTGIFLRECEQLNRNIFPILTLSDCNLTGWYKRKNIKYKCPNENVDMFDVLAYHFIKDYYKDKCAKRSGLPYINHIEEGLAVGVYLDCQPEALEAYMLHPIFQDEIESQFDLSEIEPNILQLAKDYATVANAYLPYSGSRQEAEAALKDVENTFYTTQMLAMDKIQNYKDFKLYNSNHPNAELLTKYFEDWFDILELPNEITDAAERLISIS